MKNEFKPVSFKDMTIEEYTLFQKQFDDPAAFEFYRNLFFEQRPDVPRPKRIKKLDLVMKKECALEILSGRKAVEIRKYSDFYVSRMYDKAVLDFEENNWDNELLRLQMLDFNDSVRAVETIHFHDYGKTWFLDVECTENNTVVLVDDQVEYLRDEFGFHEFDDELAELNARGEDKRPLYFYYVIGKILDTDLR